MTWNFKAKTLRSFLLEQENMGVLVFSNEEWRILDSNQKTCKILGLSHAQLIQKRLQEVVHLPREIADQMRNSKAAPGEIIAEATVFLENRTMVMSVMGRLSQNEFYFLFFLNKESSNNLFVLHLRYFVKNILFAGIIVDEQERLLFCSQMFCKLTGYRAAEILGRKFFETFLPDPNTDPTVNYLKLGASRGMLPKTIEFAIKKTDGTSVPLLWNLETLSNADGKIMGFAGIGVDLSYLNVQSRNTLSNKKLETIIATVSALFAQTPTFKLDEAIRKTLQIVGEYANVDRSYVFIFRDNQKIMDNTHEWCAPNIEPQIENLQDVPTKIFPWWMQHLLRREIIHIPRVSELPPEANEEKMILSAQGIQSLIVVPMVEKDALVGFIGFDSVRMPKFWATEDINLLKIISAIFVSSLRRKTTELSLAQTERKYRTLFNTAPDLIFILDEKGNIESLNPAFTRLTKQKIDDWIGRPFWELLVKKDRGAFKKEFQDCLNGISQKPHEMHLQTPEGHKIMEIICSDISFGGKQHGVYGIARDITDRKMLEKNLRHAERMKSIGLLAGGIAHDFNNILGIIQGNYTILKESGALPYQWQANLESIRQAVERGKTLVQNLLTFARKKEPNYEIVDLNSEAQNITELLKQTTPKTITYRLKLSSEKLLLFYDRIQIQQLLLNLCLNAADAIREKQSAGEITITTRRMASQDLKHQFNEVLTTDYAHLQVRDNGIGMGEEEMRYIFDPFYTSKESGTGLGLAVVFGVIKALKGQVKVESTLGSGTTFHIYLPLAGKNVPEKKPKQKVEKKLLYGSARIFLIEDNVLLNQMLFQLLEINGYKVLRAYSGDKAIEEYARIKDTIDLVILDFDLPEKDGLSVAREFLKLNPAVKIIMTSGFLEPQVKQQVDALQNVFFFEKPYDPEEILQNIPAILNNRLHKGD